MPSRYAKIKVGDRSVSLHRPSTAGRGMTFDQHRDAPLCPRCRLRPQYRCANGRWRGACTECWGSTLRRPAPDGAERVNSRGRVEVGVGGRWVDKARHLARLAGVDLAGEARVRQHGDVIEVAVWQPVAAVRSGAARRASPVRRPRVGQRCQVNMDDDLYGEVHAVARAEGLTVAEWLRELARAEVAW